MIAEAPERPQGQTGTTRRGPRVRDLRDRVKGLQREVARIAEETSIPPEVLAHRKLLEKLVIRTLGSGERDLPAELEGWRAEVVGRPLLAQLLPPGA